MFFFFNTGNQVYQFFVRAEDKGKPTLETDVPIDIVVMGPDDIAPRFERQINEFFTPENSPYGTLITTLKVLTNDPVTYSIVPPTDKDNEDEEMDSKFEIDAVGRVVLSGTLDREEQAMHSLTVKVETESSPPLVAFADILIQVHILF